METHINEVFSSIQGEGLLIGRRQIFVRFSGCNLSCNYCDTSKSRDPYYGNLISSDDLFNRINRLKTDDLHSLSFTGGEPLLHADFIQDFLKKHKFKSLLETNGSLPDEMKKLTNLIDYVSIDIKLPEHGAAKNWDDLFELELESIKLFRDKEINTYCKVVVMPQTELDMITYIASTITNEIKDTSNFAMVIHPVSPLNNWVDAGQKLLTLSEAAGKYIEVLTIPQIHKLLNIK